MARHYITAQVSRSAIRHNLRLLRDCIGRECKLFAAVKSDAYGHGLAGLLETLSAGVDGLAVATIPEALQLRSLGYAGAVLTNIACAPRAGGAQLQACADAIVAGVTLTLTDAADAAPLARLAEKLSMRADVHVKIDTGMGRSGAVPAEALALIDRVRQASSLRLTGVYTHFACSDESDKGHAEQQFALFMETLRQVGPLPGVLRHAANSAAVCDLPHMALDAVRPGIAVYGYQPSDELHTPLPLRPCLRVTAPILQAKWLPAGATCGYGRITRLDRDSRVGIVPMGYADGLPRALSGRFAVKVRDQLARTLGRVSMDQIIVDLTDCPEARPGEEVEVISPDPNAPNSVENLARAAGTIPYEITCRLGARINRDVIEDFAPGGLYEPGHAAVTNAKIAHKAEHY